jgi:Skp family chaperone for outer membrane proteins
VILAGLATLGVGVYLGNQVWAQQGGQQAAQPAAAPLQTKIALVNIAQVIKNYNKYKGYQAQLKSELAPVEKELEAKRAAAVAKENEATKPETPPARREQLQKEIRAMQREMQDKIDEINSTTAKKRVEQLKTIYGDVQDAVAAFAKAYAYELVLQYSDGADTAEKMSGPALQQKLGNGACFPLYVDPRMDITAPVLQMLNQHYAQTVQPASATSPQPAGAGR